MLALLNNFVAQHNDIVVDLESGQAYLLMQKCGTQSLLELVKRKPNKFSLVSSKEFVEGSTRELTVFVREPISRFLSGITTQMLIYQIPKHVFENILNVDHYVPMFDTHTMPQFWFLLRFGVDTDLRFKIKDLSTLDQIDDTIKKINVNPPSEISLSEQALMKVDYAMTEDIVLYNNFRDTVVSMSDIINRLSQEVNYVNELDWYKKVFPYIRNTNG